MYNYNAREDTDVSFIKGDRMEVLDDTESDWWRVIVRNRNSQAIALVLTVCFSALDLATRGPHTVELRCRGEECQQ